MLLKLILTLGTLISSASCAERSDSFWTLDHDHDVRFALRKIKQKGFVVENKTILPAQITLKGKRTESSPLEEIKLAIPQAGSLTFPADLTYLDLSPAVCLEKRVYTNLKRDGSIYRIVIEDKPHPFGQFGRVGFGFDFNYLKQSPLHRSEHQIHPIYFKEDGIPDPQFLENEFYEEIKKAQKEFEEAETLEEKTKAAREVKCATENWHNWIKDYFTDATEERRIFLENDELLYLQNVIRQYDPSYGLRKEKRFKALLDTKEKFDQANEGDKEQTFRELFKAQIDWHKWTRQYNGNVWFLENLVLQGTGVTREGYKKLLNTQYAKHHPGEMFEYLRHHPVGLEDRKIPAYTHTLWFTHPDKPVDFPYIESLKRSSLTCPREQGFTHYLWVLDKRLMADTMEKLDQRLHQTPAHGFGADIIVKEFSEFGNFALKQFVEDSVYKERKMGMATDAFRAVLLEKEGGIYMDADFEALQSFSPWLNYYDGVFNLEPMSSYVGNAFFMAAPKHPVLRQLKKIIKRNISVESRPKYITDVLIEDPVYATISITGPGALTEAVALKLGKHHRVDVVLPHPFFYPSMNNIYPEEFVQKSTLGFANTFDEVSWGVHKWHTTWDQKAFGSNG